MAERLKLLTPAKINLFLRVTGRRADGYHQLDSVFLPVTLFDQVSLTAEESRRPSVELSCNWPGLPLDRRNLAVYAAERFMENIKCNLKLRIDLRKRIFAGAGLGGGSSDAGAVLRILARLYPQERAVLRRTALEIGADVPFFLDPRPARIGGIGERIEPIVGAAELDLVIAVPPVEISTARVYAALRPDDFSGPAPGDISAMIAGSEIGPEMLVNDLEAAAVRICPTIAEIKATLKAMGARGAAMSGSGSAVFGIFADPERASWAAERLGREVPETRCRTARVSLRPEEIG